MQLCLYFTLLQKVMYQTSLFQHEMFKKWMEIVREKGCLFSGRIVCPNGDKYHIGDPDKELQYWDKEVSKVKRKSMDWLKDPSTLKKLETQFVALKQKQATYETPFVVRHFIGERASMGSYPTRSSIQGHW